MMMLALLLDATLPLRRIVPASEENQGKKLFGLPAAFEHYLTPSPPSQGPPPLFPRKLHAKRATTMPLTRWCVCSCLLVSLA